VQTLLRRYPLFALLEPARLGEWLADAQEMTFAVGETILQSETPGTSAYLTLEGHVRVVRPAPRRGEVSLGVFGPGDLFGEYALLPPHRNTATCRATGAVRLLRLPLAPVPDLFGDHPRVWSNLKNWLRLHTLLHYLRGRSFLGFLSAPSALLHLERLRTESFAAGETLQAEGLAADRWYVVEEGQIRLRPEGEDGPVVELGAGECFGECGLLEGSRIPLAEAATDVRRHALTRDDFAPSGHPSIQTIQGRPASVKPYVWVGQERAEECGLAALAMIAQYRGLNVSVAPMRQAVAVGRAGLSLAQMCRLAVGLGMPCQAVRVGVERWREIRLPAVAHLRDAFAGRHQHGLALPIAARRARRRGALLQAT
jgi:CRP-like cAMP-binding protein